MKRRIYRHPDDGDDGAQVLATYNEATDELLVAVRAHESDEWSQPFKLVRDEDDTAEQAEAGPRYPTFFMLRCATCDAKSFQPDIPFGDTAARSAWWAEHRQEYPDHEPVMWTEQARASS